MAPRTLLAAVSLFAAASLQAASPSAYVGVPPCRIADTRIGGGPLANGEIRQFALLGDRNLAFQGGSATGCGLPQEAIAVTLNFTAVSPGGVGHLTAFGAHEVQPLASALNFSLGTTIANALPINVLGPIVCPAGEDCGELNVHVVGAAADLVIDVYGYFVVAP